MFHVYWKAINIKFCYSFKYFKQLGLYNITCIFLRDENVDSRNNGYVTILKFKKNTDFSKIWFALAAGNYVKLEFVLFFGLWIQLSNRKCVLEQHVQR